ncbi:MULTISPECIES: hypothetical protein [Bacillaceae]|uniref:hypothetical protein n=1 Tax=Bacillaceae TaxID=186817 RepID=UPI000BFDC935|nr:MULTISPECIES: hypothetical protein [Bacillaceae]PGT74842.1 hypothetical protein COD11_26350 [Bacillus sp. AFS040349]UGB29115.1 hypothetical protein LPC09_15285 [Metabacillus sp. B2-18]
MSQHYYNLCCRYTGKVVRINDRNGRVHVGRIHRVTPNRVFIQPMVRGGRGGFGYGYYGGGWGWGPAYGIGIGFITGIALAGLLWW